MTCIFRSSSFDFTPVLASGLTWLNFSGSETQHFGGLSNAQPSSLTHIVAGKLCSNYSGNEAMMGRTFGALALCTIGLAGCMEGGTQTQADLLNEGWKPSSTGDELSVYAQRSPEPGKKYWVLSVTDEYELLEKYEFDCKNKRLRELVPVSDRITGVAGTTFNPDWRNVLDFFPQSKIPILHSNVCNGLI